MKNDNVYWTKIILIYFIYTVLNASVLFKILYVKTIIIEKYS